MITKEKFISIIENFQEWYRRIDEISKILKCSVLELDWVEYGALTFDTLIELAFDAEGQDLINWWIFEKSEDPTLKIKDKNGKELLSETVEDLWELVKEYRN